MFGSTSSKETARGLALSQIGFEMAAPALLGLLIDYWMDWGPWGVIGGAVLGLVGGLAHLVQLTNQNNGTDKNAREQNAEPKEPPSK